MLILGGGAAARLAFVAMVFIADVGVEGARGGVAEVVFAGVLVVVEAVLDDLWQVVAAPVVVGNDNPEGVLLSRVSAAIVAVRGARTVQSGQRRHGGGVAVAGGIALGLCVCRAHGKARVVAAGGDAAHAEILEVVDLKLFGCQEGVVRTELVVGLQDQEGLVADEDPVSVRCGAAAAGLGGRAATQGGGGGSDRGGVGAVDGERVLILGGGAAARLAFVAMVAFLAARTGERNVGNRNRGRNINIDVLTSPPLPHYAVFLHVGRGMFCTHRSTTTGIQSHPHPRARWNGGAARTASAL